MYAIRSYYGPRQAELLQALLAVAARLLAEPEGHGLEGALGHLLGHHDLRHELVVHLTRPLGQLGRQDPTDGHEQALGLVLAPPDAVQAGQGRAQPVAGHLAPEEVARGVLEAVGLSYNFV